MDTDAIAAEEALRKEEKPQMGAAAAMELARTVSGRSFHVTGAGNRFMGCCTPRQPPPHAVLHTTL